jgi:hypothetical protein
MDVDDGPIGFHAQQGVEKTLKIALVPPMWNCRVRTISSSWSGCVNLDETGGMTEFGVRLPGSWAC